MNRIERVARALAKQYTLDDGYDAPAAQSAYDDPNMWRNFKAAARVAIAAMRELIPAMIEVGCGEVDRFKAWEAIIDSVLAEK